MPLIVKRLPEDFQVEELPLPLDALAPGPFVIYRLTKRGIGTIEALEAIRRRWKIDAVRMSHGGLKDRHAVTIQFISIKHGPNQTLEQTSFNLEPVATSQWPYGPGSFTGNRFRLVLRNLRDAQIERASEGLESAPRDGLANYFDDQRFGSLGESGEFIAEAWLKGDHERAFRLALAEPNPHDRPDTKREKAILRETWGDWPAAKARLDRSHARSLVTYLADHPIDFKGAFIRIRRDLRSLHFSAFQSHLWNLLLARAIEADTEPSQRGLVRFRAATLPFPKALSPEQAEFFRGLELPLPSARTAPPEGPVGDWCREIAASRGLAWEDLRIKGMKDLFFSKGMRKAFLYPHNLTFQIAADDLYPGRRKLALEFELDKGCYATLLVKRLGLEESGEAEARS